MGSASYLLGVRDSDGVTALEIAIDRIDGHIVVFDEGGFPLPVRLFPGTLPPTGKLPVFDESETLFDVELTPILIAPDLLDVQSGLLDYSVAINPGTLTAVLAPLPIDLALSGSLAPDVLEAASSPLDPVITFSDVVVEPAAVLDGSMSALAPTAIVGTAGVLAPDVVGAASSTLLPRLAFSTIDRPVEVLSASSAALSPTLVFGTQVIKVPVLTAPLRTQVPSLLLVDEGVRLIDLVTASMTTLVPVRSMGARVTVPDTALGALGSLDPAEVGTSGPPTNPAPNTATAAPLEPVITGTGSRAPDIASGTAEPIEPAAIVHSTPAKQPAVVAGIAQALEPEIVGELVVDPADATSASASVLSPSVLVGLPVGLGEASFGALDPDVVLERVVVLEPVSASATTIRPDVDSPLEVIEVDAPATSEMAALTPAEVGCRGAIRQVEAPVLTMASSARRAALVDDLAAPQILLHAEFVTEIDFTEERDVEAKCQQNQVGLHIDVDIKDSRGLPLSLEGATEVYAWLRPPSGASKRKTGQVFGSPSNGVVRYTSEAGDLHEHGQWSIQISAVLEDGGRVWSSVEVFKVEPNLGPYQPTAIAPQALSVLEPLEPTISFSP